MCDYASREYKGSPWGSSGALCSDITYIRQLASVAANAHTSRYLANKSWVTCKRAGPDPACKSKCKSTLVTCPLQCLCPPATSSTTMHNEYLARVSVWSQSPVCLPAHSLLSPNINNHVVCVPTQSAHPCAHNPPYASSAGGLFR